MNFQSIQKTIEVRKTHYLNQIAILIRKKLKSLCRKSKTFFFERRLESKSHKIRKLWRKKSKIGESKMKNK